jgi:thioredoxin 1
MLTPVIEELALELDGKVKIYKFNVDGNTEIPESYQIMSIPSLLLFRDGVLVSQKTGMCPKKIILDWINSSL